MWNAVATKGPSALLVSSLASQTWGDPPVISWLSGVTRPKVNRLRPTGSGFCASAVPSRESCVAPALSARSDPAGAAPVEPPFLAPLQAVTSAETARAPTPTVAERSRSRRESRSGAGLRWSLILPSGKVRQRVRCTVHHTNWKRSGVHAIPRINPDHEEGPTTKRDWLRASVGTR